MGEPLAGVKLEPDVTSIRVGLGERSYDIWIGERLLDVSAARIAALLPRARYAVISDANVAPLYLPVLKASLAAHGLYLGEVVVAPAEASKSFPVLAEVCQELLNLGVERGDAVIALGGGVVGGVAFALCKCRRRCSPRSIPRLGAKPASTCPRARI
jgi:3-dehydroquinate synthase